MIEWLNVLVHTTWLYEVYHLSGTLLKHKVTFFLVFLVVLVLARQTVLAISALRLPYGDP